MVNRLLMRIWFRKNFSRRRRFLFALLFALTITVLLLFCLPSVVPGYMLTLGGKYTVKTPRSFELGQMYDFSGTIRDAGAIETQGGQYKELVLPLPDNREITFQYPEVITLGRPTYLSNEISQSVDFMVREPPATGLIQIWALNMPLDDFLEASRNHSTVEYIHFATQKEKKGHLNYTVWDYTFYSRGSTIHGLEAFFDDEPYMYRISVYVDNTKYNESFRNLFDELVRSVTIK